MALAVPAATVVPVVGSLDGMVGSKLGMPSISKDGISSVVVEVEFEVVDPLPLPEVDDVLVVVELELPLE
jgi:hypothetical protein